MESARRYRNLHVPLPEDLDRRLRRAAKREGAPATTVARRAIESWLEEWERLVVSDAVADYARSVAGTPADLDSQLEAEAADQLARESDESE